MLEAFPAHAGMNRRLNERVSVTQRVPHARGDEPDFVEAILYLEERSPRTRG